MLTGRDYSTPILKLREISLEPLNTQHSHMVGKWWRQHFPNHNTVLSYRPLGLGRIQRNNNGKAFYKLEGIIEMEVIITKHHNVFLNHVAFFFFFFNLLPRKPLEENTKCLLGCLGHSHSILSWCYLILALQFMALVLKHQNVNENQ